MSDLAKFALRGDAIFPSVPPRQAYFRWAACEFIIQMNDGGK